MARIYSLIFLLPLLLSACAEVGTISGGPEDTVAPKPIEDKMEYTSGSVNFTGNGVEIPFDEFIRLNEPNINIRMVPPHATINASLKGKSLFLNWTDTLEPNTTYAIYLNNAVRDITENNDSIIQYVFSTGPKLDTLRHQVAISDAWTGKGVASCMVALFDPENGQLQSFAETNNQGIATLNYLRPGSYTLLAFQDENNDLELQEHEQLAFPSYSLLNIDEEQYFDSIPLRMFVPVQAPEIRTIKAEFPGVLILGATQGLEGAEVFVNGQLQDSAHIKWLGPDSLMTFMDVRGETIPEIRVNSSLLQDTLRVRTLKSDRLKSVNFRNTLVNGKCSPLDSATLLFNDYVLSVDTSKISVLLASDSSRVDYSVSFQYNELTFHFPDRMALEAVQVIVGAGAVTGTNGSNIRMQTTFNFPSEKKFGTMVINTSSYTEPILLMVQQADKTIRTVSVPASTAATRLEYLDPGEYSFKVIRDSNGNGRWDVGNYAERLQPETVDFYSEPTKVRANWELEFSLIPLDAP